LLARPWGGDRSLFACVYCSDERGIVEAWGQYSQPTEQVDDAMMGAFEEGVAFVDIDLAAARGMLAAAVQAAATNGRSLPPMFELWEPFFHDSFPPEDEPVTEAELDDAPYAGRRDLVRRSAKLLEQPMFDSWFVDPDEIGSVVTDEITGIATWGGAPPPYAELIIPLFTAEKRRQLRHRLRRQAWLLDRTGKTQLRNTALAVAASLADISDVDAGEHTFLCAMLDLSISNIASALFGGLYDI
jgi:hypothetical protein